MGKHNFRYFFHEGLSNMFSHGFMTFAAVGITVACLLIMGTFTLVAVNADEQLRELEQENEVLAYVDETFDPETTQEVGKALEKIPGVTQVTFVSRQEAMDAFAENYPEEDVVQNLDPNILEDRYAVRVGNLKQLSQIVEKIRQVPGVVDVNAYEAVAGGFITIRNVATVVCVALITVLFLVSVFIISNTIKLTTFDRRDEIAIMRMVGATKGFIRWPFVYEGSMMGFLGAVIAFFLQWGLYSAVAHGVATNDTLQLLEIIPFQELWGVVAVTFGAAGILIGVGGSLSAIRKFLQV